MLIRPILDRDAADIWRIFHGVVAGRDAYPFHPDTPRDEALSYWYGDLVTAYVAELDGCVAGMYKLIANTPGLGAHVSNASFMVDPAMSRRGVGRAMGRHGLREARRQAYDAMQFNFVVSTNHRAVALWQRLGFRIVGTSPKAFRHGSLGLVDAYVMHRFLDDIDLTFGADEADATGGATVRPSAYAVVANDAGEIAIVQGLEGVMLPGGGIDPGESPEDAAIRETAEECACRIAIAGQLGSAVQFVRSQREATTFEKRSTFVSARLVADLDDAIPEHPTDWLTPDGAMKAVTYESHEWAIRRWVRLNT